MGVGRWVVAYKLYMLVEWGWRWWRSLWWWLVLLCLQILYSGGKILN
jgi:hypothetical protein